MTTQDDFDRRIADRLHAEAPGRAPEFLMESTMNRIADTPQRPGRFLGSTGGRLLAAAAVLVLAVVAGTQLPRLLDRQSATGGSPSPSASAAPSETPAPTVSPSAAPSDTASPSATAGSGELPTGPAAALMSFSAACDVSGPVTVPATTVLEDGRVIWRDEDGDDLLVRQLAPESLEDFREQVRSTGLFETSGRYELERRAGTPEPPGHGLCVWSFTWNDGGADVEVISVGWQGDEEEATYYEPAPERRTLDELATQLRDPTTWYGDDGWSQPEAAPYEPDEYLVIATVNPPQLATEGAPDFDDVTWPFEQPPDQFGVVYDDINQPPSRCGVATAQAIETLAAELAAAALEQFELPARIGAGAALPWAARDAAVDMSFWPMLPDGRPLCGPEG
jgi:hypothetical protein